MIFIFILLNRYYYFYFWYLFIKIITYWCNIRIICIPYIVKKGHILIFFHYQNYLVELLVNILNINSHLELYKRLLGRLFGLNISLVLKLSFIFPLFLLILLLLLHFFSFFYFEFIKIYLLYLKFL